MASATLVALALGVATAGAQAPAGPPASAKGQPAGAVAAAAAPTSPAAVALHKLLDEHWDWLMRAFPEWASSLGDRRFDDRLTDNSAAAILRRRAEQADFLRRMEAIDPAALDPTDRTSRAMFIAQQRAQTDVQKSFAALPIWGPSPITSMNGPQLGLPQLARRMPFKTVQDYENYLQRLRAIPLVLANLGEQLRVGADTGWTPPRAALSAVSQQIGAQVVADPQQSRFYAPFRALPADLPAAEQERLRAAGLAVVRDEVIPAFARLRETFDRDYLPRTRTTIGAAQLPGGRAFYDAVLREQTTTGLTAEQIHATGLAEVARIEAEMDAVMRKTGFTGTRDEFRAYLWSDPKFFAASPEAMLARYRDIAKRVDAQLPRLFRELPRLPYGIEAMPAERGTSAEYYEDGSADNGRAGLFMANVNNLKTRALWQMTSLTLHEAAPGHHTQNARASELPGLPRFRTEGGITAYGEGWALYAEKLGNEIGMYADPYDKYGNLSFEQLRAARMVVDTGLHAKGWTRQQAIDYMKAHTMESDPFIVAEVDRYIVWPGQATAYKVGEMKILELRARAQAALGDRFDLRDFHNVVLDSAAVPLTVLESNVDAWIAQQRAAVGATPAPRG